MRGSSARLSGDGQWAMGDKRTAHNTRPFREAVEQDSKRDRRKLRTEGLQTRRSSVRDRQQCAGAGRQNDGALRGVNGGQVDAVMGVELTYHSVSPRWHSRRRGRGMLSLQAECGLRSESGRARVTVMGCRMTRWHGDGMPCWMTGLCDCAGQPHHATTIVGECASRVFGLQAFGDRICDFADAALAGHALVLAIDDGRRSQQLRGRACGRRPVICRSRARRWALTACTETPPRTADWCSDWDAGVSAR